MVIVDAVPPHLQQLDEGVMLFFYRDVYEAVHQQYANEVTHLLPSRVREAGRWELPCSPILTTTLEACGALHTKTEHP